MQYTKAKSGQDKPRVARDHGRGFVEVPILEAGRQIGQDRFADFSPRQLRDETSPYLSSWRNNLTALSQTHDLYFIAYEDEIHVFRPNFPAYTVPSTPSCIIRLPSTGSNRPGHTADSKPHSVNNVLVDNLGLYEVLLCAIDDGDVLVYWTDRIEEFIGRNETVAIETRRKQLLSYAIRTDFAKYLRDDGESIDLTPTQPACGAARPGNKYTDPPLGNMKPLLLANVGESAWGLAVDSHHRRIAVSSNNHKITIFNFACTAKKQDKVAQAEQEKTHNELYATVDTSRADGFWDVVNRRDLKNDFITKHLNSCTTLREHRTNIPSIAFNNAGMDQLLVSTDIAGLLVVWDVPSGDIVRMLGPKIRVGPGQTFGYEGYDRTSGGWGAMFVDRRAFIPAHDIRTAMGICMTYSFADVFVADISHTKVSLKQAAPLRVDDQNLLTTALVPQQPGPRTEDDEVSASIISSIGDNAASDSEMDGHDYVEPIPSWDESSGSATRRIIAANKAGTAMHETVDRAGIQFHDLRHTLTADISFANPRYTLTSTSPIILLNPRKITLFQTPDLCRRNRKSPVVAFEDPLYQLCSAPLARVMADYDRLNLYHCIPELGVLLVGTPKGRVAVLTLRSLENPFVEEHAEMCTIRLDHILPTTEQEEKGVRSLQPLAGLAASPVPGSGGDGINPARATRWRVMLMYRDHTLLSYELIREGSGELELGV